VVLAKMYLPCLIKYCLIRLNLDIAEYLRQFASSKTAGAMPNSGLSV
jgi:hypothetical protein